MKVGLVGLGVIGKAVCRALDEGIAGLSLVGANALNRNPAESFLATLRSRPPFLILEALIERSDMIIEAATQGALATLAPKVLEAGKDLMVLSCGALLERSDWIELARRNGCRILVPSGAIAGLDGVKGARQGSITSVTMETRKAPRGWAGAPHIEEKRIDLGAITKETLLFEGAALQACKAFPANVNVVAALSLAGIGPEKTWIKIFAVPGLPRNTHRVIVEGEFGRLDLSIENVPTENPRTGRLSYLSTIAMLKELNTPFRVGT